jgi:hypothetical protein
MSDAEEIIRNSEWWDWASKIHDRHYDESENVYLTDHLNSVLNNCKTLLDKELSTEYIMNLQIALESCGLCADSVLPILTSVALLHDIGKAKEDKETEIPHPLTGKSVKKRHPVASVIAAIEILPKDLDNRDQILVLIDEHDTPFSWYMNYDKTGQVPSEKAWNRLDRKINEKADGTGMLLLSLFKLADIDGHEDVADVIWFLEQANENCLIIKGKEIPVPNKAEIEQIGKASAS